MPKLSKEPVGLRPYLFHGVTLYLSQISGSECPGVCPACSRADKFSVNIDTSQGQCKHGGCRLSVNGSSFLIWLWEQSDGRTGVDYSGLASERKLLFPDTLMHWGVVRCLVTDRWLIPGYNVRGKLCQLYVWANMGGHPRLLATPTFNHQLHHPTAASGDYDPSKPEIYLCEGPWDAMALWETMGSARWDEGGKSLISTADRASSLLADANVMAVPGCMTFVEAWLPLFADKTVYLLYDSDHPKKSKPGKTISPAGLAGMHRVSLMLTGADDPPHTVRYLRWGKDGYAPELPSGTDLRDILT